MYEGNQSFVISVANLSFDFAYSGFCWAEILCFCTVRLLNMFSWGFHVIDMKAFSPYGYNGVFSWFLPILL